MPVDKIKYNMMCGKRNFGEDWRHVDGAYARHHLHNDISLEGELSDIVDLFYCSHGIAYFTKKESIQILHAWYRVIKPGGILRIATPDLHKIGWMLSNGLCMVPEVLGPIYGVMQMNGQTIQHKTGYDFATLAKLLADAGFIDVQMYDHRTTEHPNTGDRSDKFDDCSAAYLHGELISLNIQATKPL